LIARKATGASRNRRPVKGKKRQNAVAVGRDG